METGRIAQAPRATTTGEVKRLLELDRLGEPYLVLRDEHNELVGIGLAGHELLAVGRDEVCELSLPWDGAVSRLHAELVCRAGAWMVLDDGLSKNGTFVNGERLHGRRRLPDEQSSRRTRRSSSQARTQRVRSRRWTCSGVGWLPTGPGSSALEPVGHAVRCGVWAERPGHAPIVLLVSHAVSVRGLHVASWHSAVFWSSDVGFR